MPTRKNILDDIQEHIDNGERVLVTVGDFGTQKMARLFGLVKMKFFWALI